MTNGRGLLLSDDLIFSSKILATARAHGGLVQVCKSSDSLLSLVKAEPPACIILDLHFPGLELLKLLNELESRPTIIGYGSHVDTATLKAARQAGLDHVMPRSQFVEQLESELPNWLGLTRNL